MFGPLLNSFCQDFNLTMSDEAMLPKNFLSILVMLITLAAGLIIKCPSVQPTPQ